MNFRGLYYNFNAVKLYLNSKEIDTAYIFNICGNILIHIYLLTIINFVLLKGKLIIKVLNDLNDISKIIYIQNFTTLRYKLYFYIIFIYLIYFYFQFSFIVKIKISFMEFLVWLTHIISDSNQISIELQFWTFCYVIMNFFKSLNNQLTYFVNNPNGIEPKLSKLRTAHEKLSEICERVNEIYNNCLLSFLCVLTLYIQYDIYSILVHLIGYFLFEEYDHNLLREFMWIVFQICRVLQPFWICSCLVHQVRFILLISVTHT
jgi:hypothetical protein